jgi:hypothetical protein
MKNIHYILAGILSILFCCKDHNNNTNIGEAKYIVPINIKEKKPLNLSKSLEFKKYISLETTKESLIKHIEKMYFTDSSIIVFDDRIVDDTFEKVIVGFLPQKEFFRTIIANIEMLAYEEDGGYNWSWEYTGQKWYCYEGGYELR